MKVLIATPLYPPEVGGPATYAEILKKAWGDDAILVKFSDVRKYPKILRHLLYFWMVLQAARSADVVLALDPVSVGLPAMKAAQKAGKKFVVKIVGDYAWEQGVQRFGVTQTLDDFVKTKQPSFAVRRLQEIQTKVAQAAVRIIVPSEYLKKIVMSWGISPDKIRVIYNAVSTDTIGSVPEVVAKLPRPLVVTVGRLVSWKGIEGLIRVFDGIWDARREGSDASLVIIGTGPEEKKLKAHADTLGIRDHCLFTGELSHADTLAVMKAADVFVLNSSYEGLSHTLIEALKLGLCIIATNAGGNPEIIHRGEGILINVDDERLLGSSLKMLIEHQEKRTQFSVAAKESANRFSVEAMLSETKTLLQTV